MWAIICDSLDVEIGSDETAKAQVSKVNTQGLGKSLKGKK